MKTTTNTNQTTAPATFADLLRRYEKHATHPTTTDYTNALLDLATAVAFSVLKKCINTSNNPTLVQTRRELAKALHDLDRTTYAINNATETKYNANGDKITAILDKDLYKETERLCRLTLGDGIDLVNDAVIAILEETEKAKNRNDGILPNQFLETTYPIRRLKRKVYIKTAESVKGWESVNVTAIQEIYKAVRRSINQSKAIQTDPRNGYTYLTDISTDPESGTDETIYRRFGKYADIGGAVTDFNGKETAYTADVQTAQDFDILITALNLSTQQSKILALRVSGYGYKAIATYLGVRPDHVTKQIKRIRTKALAIGLNPEKLK